MSAFGLHLVSVLCITKKTKKQKKKKLAKQPRQLKITCHPKDVKNNTLYTTVSAS